MKGKNKIMLFEQFLNESYKRDEFQKVMITRRAELKDSFITVPKYTPKDYWVVVTRDTDLESIPKDLPVLCYDRKTLENLLDKGIIQNNQVYNNIEARKSVSSKAEFYKLHADSGYITPTVLDPKDIKELKFPIVAKPDNEHSGLGIQVFKSKEELDDADLSKFSSFSEKIDIKEEHRFFVWRGEMIQWTQRKQWMMKLQILLRKTQIKKQTFHIF